MNSVEIESVLTKATPPNACLGVFPANLYVQPTVGNTFCVFNSKCWPCAQYEAVGHWIALFKTSDGQLEFFDSFAMHPTHYGYENFALPVIYSQRRLQSYDADTCGHFCTAFCILRCQGFSFEQFLSLFDENDTERNDRDVAAFVQSHVQI